MLVHMPFISYFVFLIFFTGHRHTFLFFWYITLKEVFIGAVIEGWGKKSKHMILLILSCFFHVYILFNGGSINGISHRLSSHIAVLTKIYSLMLFCCCCFLYNVYIVGGLSQSNIVGKSYQSL